MGTTSEKLTYLNTTKEKIRDSINLTGANLTSEDTFRSYASKLKKGYIDIINNGIDTLYNNFPKVSGIGSNLSLTPTYEAPMKLNEIQGSSLQDGTPTPSSPVPIQSVTGLQNVNVCGKNLCFNITKPSNANLRFFINKSISKTFTISFTTNEALNGNSLYLEVDGTGYGNIGGITASANTKVEKTYTLSDANYQAIQDGTNINLLLYKNGANFNIPDDGMVENNSTATSYEPYKSNTYEVNLGKNLFDINGTFSTGLIKYNNGFQLIKNSTNRTTNYFPASPIPAGTYTLSYKIVSSTLSDITKCIAQAFNSSNTPIATKQFSNGGYVTFTTTGDITKIYFYISNTETDDTQITLDNIQLEKGSTSTSFSPYFTPIELNKIGNYQDSIKKSTGKNLFDKDNVNSLQAYFNTGATNKISASTNARTIYIPCKPNTTYTISKITSARFYVGYTNETPALGVEVFGRDGENNKNTPITITTGANATYIVSFIYLATAEALTLQQILDTIQIEENNQATTYEPYGKVWYVEKQIGKVVLDINLSGVASTNFSNVYQIYANVMNISYLIGGFCDNFKFNDNSRITDNTNANNYLSDNQCALRLGNESARDRFYVKSTNFASANELKTYFNTNPTTLYYVLATPTYTEITNTELIEDLETLYTAKSQEGTTNISITSEDLEMILNVSALKGDA